MKVKYAQKIPVIKLSFTIFNILYEILYKDFLDPLKKVLVTYVCAICLALVSMVLLFLFLQVIMLFFLQFGCNLSVLFKSK